jgi:GNAT superfamily N-acetyltransferase
MMNVLYVNVLPFKHQFDLFCTFTNMIIRPATLKDVPTVMQVVKAVVPLMNAAGNMQWDSTYPNAAVFEKDISLNQLWVAEIDGSIAGIAAITTDQEPEYAQVGWDINETAIVTHRLAVNPQFQGKGVAVALLQQAEQNAIARNISLLRIDTNTMNEATQKLFPKLGYIFAGEIGLSFRPGLRFYCYEKRLRVD